MIKKKEFLKSYAQRLYKTLEKGLPAEAPEYDMHLIADRIVEEEVVYSTKWIRR